MVAFALLAAGLCVRSLLGETPEIQVTRLIWPVEAAGSASPFITQVVYLVTAGGILACILWLILTRRQWRTSGFEIGAAILLAAAVLSVPMASQKRLALNTAIDVLLPLSAAAALYQILLYCPHWRRALLAILLGCAAAQCWRATVQRGWEYQRERDEYRRNKAAFWAQRGVDPGDPIIAVFEADQVSRQPVGYFNHPNILASFLLLGIGGAATAGAIGRRNGTSARAGTGGDTTGRPTEAVPARLVAAVLAAGLVLWQLVVLAWIRSLGATVGLASALIATVVFWRFRGQGRGAAVGLLAGMLILQAALTGLGLRARNLYPTLAGHGGKTESLAVRLNYWDAAARLCAEHPLTGVGPGQYRRHYNAIKPIYAAEEPFHPHNWLLGMAAEWGLPGALATVAVLIATGRRIFRAADSEPRDAGHPARAGTVPLPSRDPSATGTETGAPAALWPALSGIAVCALLVGADLPEKQWPMAAGSLAAGLIAAGAASLVLPAKRFGRAILAGSLTGFVVHATVEMTGGAPAALWPFWATVALAMTWTAPAPSPARSRVHRAAGVAGPVLTGLVCCTVIILTITPLRASLWLRRAEKAIAAGRTDVNLLCLRQAATIDRLDPDPLSAAGMLCARLASRNASRQLSYMQEAAGLFEAAVQRDPLRHLLWRNWAAGTMRLARHLNDPSGIDLALKRKQREIELYPNNPQGRLELARMLMAASQLLPLRKDLSPRALECLNKVLELDAGWPADDARKFGSRQLDQIRRMREEVLSRPSAQSRPAGT